MAPTHNGGASSHVTHEIWAEVSERAHPVPHGSRRVSGREDHHGSVGDMALGQADNAERMPCLVAQNSANVQ